MCYTGLFKRIIPFVLTFAAGLFLASFFVSIAFPGANWRVNRRVNRFHEMQQLRIENEDLREKLRQARLDNEELRRSAGAFDTDLVIPDAVPPVELDAHHPPPPPRKPKQPRTDILQ